MLDFANPARECQAALHVESTPVRAGYADLGKEIAMSRPIWPVTGHRIIQHGAERLNPKGFRCALVSAGSIVVLAVGLSSVQTVPLRAGDQPPAASKPHADAVQSPSGFVVESRRTLKRLQETMASLGAKVLEGLEINEPTEADIAIQSLMVESAKAGYQRAQLDRETAEIALAEYKEALFNHEKKSIETEIKLAQVELESAQRAVPQARERRAKIKQVRTGSAGDLARGWQFESGEVVAQFQEKKARFALEQAQSKLKVLCEYQGPQTERELKSRIEKARSDELARRATSELEQSKLIKLKRMKDPPQIRGKLTEQRIRALASLERAIPIEEQLSARLEQIKDGGQPDDSLGKEITELARQLQEIVDTVQGEEAAAALTRLKSRLRRQLVR
jgi:hypothetical protein